MLVIYSSTDPIEAQMLRELLEAKGITARLLGTRDAALMGAGQHIFQQRIEVPEEQAQEAEELIAAILTQVDGRDGPYRGEATPRAAEGEEAGVRAAPPSGDGEEPRDRLRPRRRVLAAGVAFCWPGASHLYMGRPWTAGFLMLSFGAGLMGLFVDRPALGGLVMMGSVAADVAGGQLAIAAQRRGFRPSRRRQIGVGILVVGAILGAAILAGLCRRGVTG